MKQLLTLSPNFISILYEIHNQSEKNMDNHISYHTILKTTMYN